MHGSQALPATTRLSKRTSRRRLVSPRSAASAMARQQQSAQAQLNSSPSLASELRG